ncbi:MAG: hypothetical protein JRF25_12115 [Deltaproteobacteria bacterium]|nr:hypothetical protein [Deltaproteobacteria bacterium]
MDIVCAENYWPLMPDGVYMAQCIKEDTRFVLGKTRKTFINFKILDEGKYHGAVIFMAFNIPYNGRVKSGSKYYKTWSMVNGWKRPSRNTKMSAKLFLNKIYKIKTRTVKPLLNKKKMPKGFEYSVVDEIIEVLL